MNIKHNYTAAKFSRSSQDARYFGVAIFIVAFFLFFASMFHVTAVAQESQANISKIRHGVNDQQVTRMVFDLDQQVDYGAQLAYVNGQPSLYILLDAKIENLDLQQSSETFGGLTAYKSTPKAYVTAAGDRKNGTLVLITFENEHKLKHFHIAPAQKGKSHRIVFDYTKTTKSEFTAYAKRGYGAHKGIMSAIVKQGMAASPQIDEVKTPEAKSVSTTEYDLPTQQMARDVKSVEQNQFIDPMVKIAVQLEAQQRAAALLNQRQADMHTNMTAIVPTPRLKPSLEQPTALSTSTQVSKQGATQESQLAVAVSADPATAKNSNSMAPAQLMTVPSSDEAGIILASDSSSSAANDNIKASHVAAVNMAEMAEDPDNLFSRTASADNNSQSYALAHAKRVQAIQAARAEESRMERLPTPQVKPPFYRKKLIVIDAGHGGKDPGAIGAGGTREKDVTLAAALELRKTLVKRGYNVVMTRDKDTFIELDNRIDVARKQKADLFISIHADSNENAKVKGTSIYTISKAGSNKVTNAARRDGNFLIAKASLEDVKDTDTKAILYDLAHREAKNNSSQFASLLVKNLRQDKFNMLTNTHRQAAYRVLLSADVPAVLLEMAFLSNESDEKNLGSEAWRKKLVWNVADSIDAYFAIKDTPEIIRTVAASTTTSAKAGGR